MTSIPKTRIQSIDLLRGLIMIIMALDHARDYFHADAFLYNPLDLEKTTPILFFTRWITHLCAPLFMFLAGTSAFFIGQKKTKTELSLFLLKRGLWLVFLELIVVNFGWGFNGSFPFFMSGPIWALGFSMIILGALIYLPKNIIFILSLITIIGHNLLDNIHFPGNNLGSFSWALLHEQNIFSWQGEQFLAGYPIIPWFAVMAMGYIFGQFYTQEFNSEKRKKNLLMIGLSLIGAFIAIRFVNIYGDPVPWTIQDNPFYTFLSFMTVNKYPPSFLYILITIGIGILFLAFSEKWKGKLVAIITVYGRVPMFYYIIHIYLIHLLAMICSELFTNVSWQNWILRKPLWFDDDLKGSGFSLTVVYLVWIFVVVALYPICKKYDAYKQSHKEKWWLSYL